MMAENMDAIGEFWVVAADRVGIWHVPGDKPLYTVPIPADSEPHFEIKMELPRPLRDRVTLMHSTSWRVDYKLGGLVVTYMVVVAADDLVRGIWPKAKPVTLAAMEAVGKPEPHAADAPPVPTHFHVLMHGLRHLRFLMDTDAETAAALDENWRRHLRPLEPALAMMYSERLAG